MLFVWAGRRARGADDPRRRRRRSRLGTLVTVDTVWTTWLPAALVILVVVVAVIWLPIRRSRAGLALYAIGSNRNAAYLAGVNVAATRDRAPTRSAGRSPRSAGSR